MNVNLNSPPLYMPAAHTRISFPPPFHQPEGNAPSSGVIVSSKLRRSSAFGKFIFIVEGRSSSVRSALVGSGSQPCCVGQVVSCGVARPELSSQQTPAHGRRATKLLLSNRASLSSERPPCRRVPAGSTELEQDTSQLGSRTFLNTDLGCARLGLLLRCGVLVLLHRPDL